MWGAVGDFEQKYLQGVVGRKKIACSTNEVKKNSFTAVRKKKKMLQSYFIIQIALQSPSEPATILSLLSFKLWIW